MARVTKAQLEATLLEKEEEIEKLNKQITKELKVVEKAKDATKSTRAAKTKATKATKELNLIKEELTQTKTELAFTKQNADTYATEYKKIASAFKTQQDSLISMNITKRTLEAEVESNAQDLKVITEESHRMILELIKFKSLNPVMVLKQWFMFLKKRSNTTYMTMYILFLVLAGITLVSSAFGFGSLVKIASTEAAGAWTFNIINTIYIGLYIYMVGEFQDWWTKLKEKFSKNNTKK